MCPIKQSSKNVDARNWEASLINLKTHHSEKSSSLSSVASKAVEEGDGEVRRNRDGRSQTDTTATATASTSKRKPSNTNIRYSKLSFPWRLHHMLNDAEQEQFENVVSWLPGGRAFKVHQTEKFVKKIMPRYFNQTKYKSFGRQLHIYGFTWVAKGDHKGSYFHPNFIRSDMSRCLNIFRKKLKVTSSQSAEVLEDVATDLSLGIPSESPNSDFPQSTDSNPSKVASTPSELNALGGATLDPNDPVSPSKSSGQSTELNSFNVGFSLARSQGGVSDATGDNCNVHTAGATTGPLMLNMQPPLPSRTNESQMPCTTTTGAHGVSSNFHNYIRGGASGGSFGCPWLPESSVGASHTLLQQRGAVCSFNMNDLEPRPIEEIIEKPQHFHV